MTKDERVCRVMGRCRAAVRPSYRSCRGASPRDHGVEMILFEPGQMPRLFNGLVVVASDPHVQQVGQLVSRWLVADNIKDRHSHECPLVGHGVQ